MFQKMEEMKHAHKMELEIQNTQQMLNNDFERVYVTEPA